MTGNNVSNRNEDLMHLDLLADEAMPDDVWSRLEARLAEVHVAAQVEALPLEVSDPNLSDGAKLDLNAFSDATDLLL